MAIAAPAYVESWDKREFPLFRERVVATGEGEVVRGHLTVAWAIVESWCADSPALFLTLLEGWMEKARAAAENDESARKGQERTLADHPLLAAELERNPYSIFRRADLTEREVRVFELRFDRQKSLIEIGQLFSLSREGVRQIIDKAIDKILALDKEEATA